MRLILLALLTSCSTNTLQTKAEKLCEKHWGINSIDFYHGKVSDIHCQDGTTKFPEDGDQ